MTPPSKEPITPEELAALLHVHPLHGSECVCHDVLPRLIREVERLQALAAKLDPIIERIDGVLTLNKRLNEAEKGKR